MRLVWLSVLASGCYLVEPGRGDDDSPPPSDAIEPPVDAESPDALPPATVFEVPCGTESAFVESTGGFRFAPNEVTVIVGQSVQFMNASSHSIVPAFPDSDAGLRVGFGATTCLQFTNPGTFNYRCNPHSSMTGVVTVLPGPP